MVGNGPKLADKPQVLPWKSHSTAAPGFRHGRRIRAVRELPAFPNSSPNLPLWRGTAFDLHWAPLPVIGQRKSLSFLLVNAEQNSRGTGATKAVQHPMVHYEWAPYPLSPQVAVKDVFARLHVGQMRRQLAPNSPIDTLGMRMFGGFKPSHRNHRKIWTGHPCHSWQFVEQLNNICAQSHLHV